MTAVNWKFSQNITSLDIRIESFVNYVSPVTDKEIHVLSTSQGELLEISRFLEGISTTTNSKLPPSFILPPKHNLTIDNISDKQTLEHPSYAIVHKDLQFFYSHPTAFSYIHSHLIIHFQIL